MSVALPIVLVGLPGAGKSKVGHLLAERLGVPHIDTDALIVEREGRAISDIFATDGEAAFRVMETAAVAHALTGHAVISLGGGAAATPAVRDLLDTPSSTSTRPTTSSFAEPPARRTARCWPPIPTALCAACAPSASRTTAPSPR